MIKINPKELNQGREESETIPSRSPSKYSGLVIFSHMYNLERSFQDAH